jgi:hypothetical protein
MNQGSKELMNKLDCNQSSPFNLLISIRYISFMGQLMCEWLKKAAQITIFTSVLLMQDNR